MTSLILRYLPKEHPLLQLQLRTHDLGGTSYETLEFLRDLNGLPEGTYFLHPDEEKKWKDKS
jgi:hypothetical protein|tara:strand:- start:299 stop:484 length:186 start_codon:yes stop_codon:yes gene_type:complete